MQPSSKHLAIAGSGLGALYLSLLLPDEFNITLVTSGDGSDGNSFMAKGGIAFPLDQVDIESHFKDTLKAGDFHGNPQVIRTILEAAPAVLIKLGEMGIVFDNHMALEGGHSQSRVRHLSDETGFRISSALKDLVLKKSNIHWLYYHQVLDVIELNGEIRGLKLFDSRCGQMAELHADAVVLATGGVSGLYLHHTNATTIHGEGHAISVKAGAQVVDMEYIQFHPTALYNEQCNTHELVTEALRGAGAELTDNDGFEFMKAIHPMGSLAPRDIVSRSMQMVMNEQQIPYLWLNYKRIQPDVLTNRFPSLAEKIKGFHNKKIPVVPAAHYTCGGVATDLNGFTGINGLYVLGELGYTGLHGANRLASNSLLELLVVGDFMSKSLPKQVKGHARNGYHLSLERPVTCIDSQLLIELNMALRSIMWEYFGILRNEVGMKSGKLKLEKIQHQLLACCMPNMIDPNLIQLIHRIETALLIANAAILNKQSKGAHFIVHQPQLA